MGIQNNRKIGNEYEEKAADYLRKKGYIIIQRNFRTRYAEIDIIARDGAFLVFCEVKYRSGTDYGSPFDAVNIPKQKKICSAAMYYCTVNNLLNCPVRFDVIGVHGDETIKHIENAFEYC